MRWWPGRERAEEKISKNEREAHEKESKRLKWLSDSAYIESTGRSSTERRRLNQIVRGLVLDSVVLYQQSR
jgi:hypothetical protein